MIPYKELKPEECDYWTLKANICTTGRQRGVSWCREKCDRRCKWDVELERREAEMRKPKPEPPKKRYMNVVKDLPRHPRVRSSRRSVGVIPYFTYWLRDYLNEEGESYARVCFRAGIHRSRISVAMHDGTWTREFEKKIMTAIGMNEGEVRFRIAEWAKKNRLEVIP